MSPNIVTIAGNGIQGYNGDNIQATLATLYSPTSIFVTSDKTMYLSDAGNRRIRKISPNGIISTIAGNGTIGYNGDNIPATSSKLQPSDMYVTSDNIIYISDNYCHLIRLISPNGIITTVAGNGIQGYNGDNIQATSAQFDNPNGLYVTTSNYVYVADTNNNRVRLISPNGIITTIAGNGTAGYNGDNIQATSAKLYKPYGVFVTSDNSIYILDLDNNRIRVISPNGIITTVAGTGGTSYNGDGILATSATLHSPTSVYIRSDHTIYISEAGNARIRVISPNGIISTIAGTGVQGYNGDDIPATSATLNLPIHVFVTSDNIIYVADAFNNRVRKISG